MRGAFVGVVGALAIAVSVAGLIEHEQRAGPLDVRLQPVIVDVAVTGSFSSTRGQEPVLGVCPQAPCTSSTSIDLRFSGLPAGTYDARLGHAFLGSLQSDGAAHRLLWQAEAFHDAAYIVLALAGRDVLVVPLAERVQMVVAASWPVPGAELRMNEIGGITISTVAKTSVPAHPPAGWEFRATLIGPYGEVDLGALETRGEESVLDARVERIGLEHQTGLAIDLRPVGGAPGFPVLAATWA